MKPSSPVPADMGRTAPQLLAQLDLLLTQVRAHGWGRIEIVVQDGAVQTFVVTTTHKVLQTASR